MVYTMVLEAIAERIESSSLSLRTKLSLTDGVQWDKLSVHIKLHSRLGYLATGRRGYPKEQACLPKARKRV